MRIGISKTWRTWATATILALSGGPATADDVEGPPEPEPDQQSQPQNEAADTGPTNAGERRAALRQRGNGRLRRAIESLSDNQRAALREHLAGLERSDRRTFLREFIEAPEGHRKDMIRALDQP